MWVFLEGPGGAVWDLIVWPFLSMLSIALVIGVCMAAVLLVGWVFGTVAAAGRWVKRKATR